MKATRSLSMAILADTKCTRRTVIFYKDNGITPIDHVVDRRLEKLGNHVATKTSYIWLFVRAGPTSTLRP